MSGDVIGWHRGAYREDAAEKVWRLSRVLDAIAEHPMLAGNLALHGGTALSLFLLEPRRLSLDLDLNYIASEERGQMLRDQTAYVGMVFDVGSELGFASVLSLGTAVYRTVRTVVWEDGTSTNGVSPTRLGFV